MENKKEKTEKKFGQKTIKFYYKNPDPHIERVLWYISYIHKKVWNIMLDICNEKFELIDKVFEDLNENSSLRKNGKKPAEIAQKELQRLKDGFEIVTREDGTTYNKSKFFSGDGMRSALGPIRNFDPELQQIEALDLQKPCNVLEGSFKSFFELVLGSKSKKNKNKKIKEGDKNARPPKYKNNFYFFTLQLANKPGESFLTQKEGLCFVKYRHSIVGAPEILIPVPTYVCKLLQDKKIRFVTITRTHADVNRVSDFEINLVYETELVEKKEITPDSKMVGVDTGARRITTVISDDPSRTKTFRLRDHDKYFTKQRQKIEAKMKLCTKGSRRYKMLADQSAVQNTGNLSRLTTFLNEKCIESGKTLIKVPDHKPSGKNKKDEVKVIGAVRNMEYGLGMLNTNPET